MIAQNLMGAFERLGRDLPGLPDQSAMDIAARARPYREDRIEPDAHGFLDDAALPDPVRRPDGGWGGACAIGIIDGAIPFAHRRLNVIAPGGARRARVASIWIQDAPRGPATADPDRPGLDLPFGAELRGRAIDRLLEAHAAPSGLDEAALYATAGALSAAEGRLGLARAQCHGAMVADMAAGFDPRDPTARRHPVIAVAMPEAVTRDTLGTLAPWFILMGTLHVLHRARRLARWIEVRRGLEAGSFRLPVVVVLAYGVTAGAKDGHGMVDLFQDAVAAAGATRGLGPMRFVVAMGNHRQSRTVARLDAGQAVGLTLPPCDGTPSFAEIWGPERRAAAAPALALALTPPGGAEVVMEPAAPATLRDLSRGGDHLARAYLSRATRPGGMAREALTLALPPTEAPAGAPAALPGLWRLRPLGPGPFEVYVQRDESPGGRSGGGRQPRLLDPAWRDRDEGGRWLLRDPPGPCLVRREGSVSAYACGSLQVRVGARDAAGRLSPYSGLGWGPDSGESPDGDVLETADESPLRPGVRSAGALSGATQRLSGTSVAAPRAARTLAHLLAAGGSG